MITFLPYSRIAKMLRVLRSLRILFFSVILFVLGTSCIGIGNKYYPLPEDASNTLRYKVELGDAANVEEILEKINNGEEVACAIQDLKTMLLTSVRKGYLNVVRVILREVAAYLDVADLQKVCECAKESSNSDIVDLIERYINKKEQSIKKQGYLTQLNEADKCIKAIGANAKDQVNNIQNACTILAFVVKSHQKYSADELKEILEERRRLNERIRLPEMQQENIQEGLAKRQNTLTKARKKYQQDCQALDRLSSQLNMIAGRCADEWERKVLKEESVIATRDELHRIKEKIEKILQN